MGLIVIRVGDEITGQVTDILHFLHGLFYDAEEVRDYIDFSQNEALKEEIAKMSITGEHLIALGQKREKANTRLVEQKLAEEIKKREDAEKRAKEEKNRAEAEIKRLREELEQLKRKVSK